MAPSGIYERTFQAEFKKVTYTKQYVKIKIKIKIMDYKRNGL